MTLSGAPIDIRTGQPAIESPTDGNEKKMEAALKDRMRYAAIGESEAAKLLIKEVEAVINDRITAVLAKDPEVRAAVQILQRISGRSISAAVAAKEYTARFYKTP